MKVGRAWKIGIVGRHDAGTGGPKGKVPDGGVCASEDERVIAWSECGGHRSQDVATELRWSKQRAGERERFDCMRHKARKSLGRRQADNSREQRPKFSRDVSSNRRNLSRLSEVKARAEELLTPNGGPEASADDT